MYESFFALQEKPFSLTPNPRFLFQSKTHNEVYAHLLYGIEHRVGFIEITGEVGTGKTTILRTLLSQLDEDQYSVAFIFNPKLNAFELLRAINHEFGVATDAERSVDLIENLNSFLLNENADGRIPVLIIDEAQNLSGEVLEQIRLLSNLETEEDKLLQVILFGQPELKRHLEDHSLRQLNQRIAVRYQLQPLDAAETMSYIRHRLKIAGRPDANIFSTAALQQVFKMSGGVPRRINLICDRALLRAFAEERTTVSTEDVKLAVAELEGLEQVAARKPANVWPVVGVAFLIGLISLVALLLLNPFGPDAPNKSSVRVAAPDAPAMAPVVDKTSSPPVAQSVPSERPPVEKPAQERAAQTIAENRENPEPKEALSPKPVVGIDDRPYVSSNPGQAVIHTTGEVSRVNWFILANPPRLVVDIYGADANFSQAVYPLGEGFSRIRVGQYPDKVRLVFDAAFDSLPAYQVVENIPEITVSWQNAAGPQVQAPAKKTIDAAASDRLVAAFNAFCNRWGVAPADSGVPTENFDLQLQLSLRGFELLRANSTMADLQTYNIPFLLSLSESQGGGMLAVLRRLPDGQWQTAPTKQGRVAFTSDELDQFAVGQALVPWVDFADIGDLIRSGLQGENVRRLQFLLNQVGCEGIPTSGYYGPQTIACVKAFQEQADLVADGLVGPQTLIRLYRATETYFMPALYE
ncbi:MAG: AAA family ATPase [Desulfuromonadales bacterium]